MPVRDITTPYAHFNALDVSAITTDTTTVGEIIDTADYDGGVNFVIRSGVITDGTYTPLLEESDDSGMSGSNVVADNDMIARDTSDTATAPEAQAAFVAANDNVTKKLGYVGGKRYVRLSLVSTGTSTGGTLSANVMKKPEVGPTIN